MEEDYFEPEDPPSCAMTLLATFASGFVLALLVFIPYLVGNESNFFLIVIVVTIIASMILLPIISWAGKRMIKWAASEAEPD